MSVEFDSELSKLAELAIDDSAYVEIITDGFLIYEQDRTLWRHPSVRCDDREEVAKVLLNHLLWKSDKFMDIYNNVVLPSRR